MTSTRHHNLAATVVRALVLLPLSLLLAASTAEAGTSIEDYLAIDRTLGPVGSAAQGFGLAAGKTGPCVPVAQDPPAAVRCLFESLPPGTGGDGRLTTLLVEGRGDPFSLAAAVLLLDERSRLEAVVLRRHVLLAVRGDTSRYFDPAASGATVHAAQAFATHGLDLSAAERVDVGRFLAHYAGRLAAPASSEPLFRRAVHVAPRSALLRHAYGAWLMGANRLEDARDELGKATRLGPDRVEAWLDRGTVLTKLGRWKTARRCFRTALRLDPRSKLAADQIRALDAEIAKQSQATRYD